MEYNSLSRYGIDDSFIQAASVRDGLFLARVISQQRNLYDIMTESGPVKARITGKMMFASSGPVDYPAVGDWVLVSGADDEVMIHEILERKSAFERKIAGAVSAGQIIASNIDVVFISMSTNENFNLRRLERYLAVAWNSRAFPCVLLTKTDLAADLDRYLFEVNEVAFGADVICCSAETDTGFKEIEAYLKPKKTYAFIGSSGVGKSTIVNHLLGSEVLATKEIGANDKGRHTTTARGLFLTPTGAIVIDTPGMRELQLDNSDFAAAFSDIESLSENCRFSDCKHILEPGCAVKEAVASGELDESRLGNYFKMQKELEHVKRRMEKAKIMEKKRERKN